MNSRIAPPALPEDSKTEMLKPDMTRIYADRDEDLVISDYQSVLLRMIFAGEWNVYKEVIYKSWRTPNFYSRVETTLCLR